MMRSTQEVLKGLDHRSLSEDIVKHAQYHYNPGRDVVFRGEFISVRSSPCGVGCHSPGHATAQRPQAHLAAGSVSCAPLIRR